MFWYIAVHESYLQLFHIFHSTYRTVEVIVYVMLELALDLVNKMFRKNCWKKKKFFESIELNYF